MNGRFVVRIVLSLVLVALIAAAGVYLYNIGLAQGRAEGAQLAGPESGVAPYFPYWRPWFPPFGFGFGFLGPIFLLILFFFVVRLLFWGPRHWRGMDYPGEGRHPYDRFEEWHRQQHEHEADQE